MNQQLEHEILWIVAKLVTTKMSEKQRKEYLRQIRHKELTIAFGG